MRARRLNTAGAFHSPLMAQAADELRAWCEKTSFAEPRFPVICNTDATPFVVGEAADRLSRHLVSPVRFDDGIRTLMACGQTRFIEAGFGGVLFNLVKRIDATLMRERIGTRDELDAFVA